MHVMPPAWRGLLSTVIGAPGARGWVTKGFSLPRASAKCSVGTLLWNVPVMAGLSAPRPAGPTIVADWTIGVIGYRRPWRGDALAFFGQEALTLAAPRIHASPQTGYASRRAGRCARLGAWLASTLLRRSSRWRSRAA